MAGLGVLGILLGAVVAWSGYNDVSAFSIIKAALSGKALPKYDQGAGARKVMAEVLGFELAKAAAQGLSSLLGLGAAAGAGAAAGGGGGAAGEGGKAPTPEPTPPEPVIPDIPLELAGYTAPGVASTSHQGEVLA